MDKKEAVVKVLDTYGCSTSKEIAVLALRDFGLALTPAQVAGTMRPLIAKGLAASSKDSKGATKYWLTKVEW